MTYEYFARTLRELGHTVHFFDYLAQTTLDKGAMNDFFLAIVKNGGYDLVWITMIADEFIPEVLDEAGRYAVLMAWNSDDDQSWENYSSQWCSHFTYMVTTYRHIYDANKGSYPNLLLSQWGCTGRYDGWKVPKDIDFSFVGKLYPNRGKEINQIRKRQRIEVYGMGMIPNIRLRGKRWLAKKLGIIWNSNQQALATEAEVKSIWNRTRVSFTPLGAWNSSSSQIKARVFDMGLSGTVMLCDVASELYEYYEPGKEYVEYDNLDECISKVKYLLTHEAERERIARAYYQRTMSEHLWSKRLGQLIDQMGIS